MAMDEDRAHALLGSAALRSRGEDYLVVRTMEALVRQMRGEGYSYAQVAEALGVRVADAESEMGIHLSQTLFSLIKSADELDRHCATCPLRDSPRRSDHSAGHAGLEAGASGPAPHPAFVPEMDELSVTQPSTGIAIRCLPPWRNEGTLVERRPEVPEYVYQEGLLLEHPAIPGLMLSCAERLYAGDLTYMAADGVIRGETTKERNFRIKWRKPIPASKAPFNKPEQGKR